MPSARTWIVLLAALLVGLVAVRVAIGPSDTATPPVAAAPPDEDAETVEREIPVGMRAVALPIERVGGHGGALSPGDRVDVVATSELPSADGDRVSRLLLEDVTVHAVGEAPSRRGGALPVSILATPEQAMSVAAAEGARFALLVRNPSDEGPIGARELAFTRESGASTLVERDRTLVDDIPPGLRAITIEVRETDGIAGVLRPGDRVDVILTSPFSTFASGGNTAPGAPGQVSATRMVSRLILQDVEVLATEQTFEGGVDRPQPARRVTLLVPPEDAERLAVATDATSRSLLRLLGRNQDDTGQVATRGQALTDLLTKRRATSRVEVVRGGRRSERTFYE